MRLLSIVGARPQFIKLAPLVHALARLPADERMEHRLLHTGQHYDHRMSDVFFDELELPPPDIHLGVGSGPQGAQTGRMLAGIEQALGDLKPDLVLLYGDTNSTLAGALAAAKLHLPLAHVEAGLRSGNRRMPEEVNRIVADHLSDLLLAPTEAAMRHLADEGLARRSVLTGDLMRDAVLHYRRRAEQRADVGRRLDLSPGGYALATLHRAENTDDAQRLAALLGAFNEIAAEELPMVLPLHPRTAARLPSALPDWRPHPRLTLIEPVGYLDSIWLADHAALVLTDSGGLQREAFFLDRPCVTLRDETEWEETISAGANLIVGADPRRLLAAVAHWRRCYPDGRADFSAAAAAHFGDGDAAGRILTALRTLGAGAGQFNVIGSES